MARFSGKVGFARNEERARGVFDDTIVERTYYGDVLRAQRNLTEGEDLHRDLRVQNSISIVADAFAHENLNAIRYVEWAGIRWTVDTVAVERPRLLLRLGEVWNGPTP